MPTVSDMLDSLRTRFTSGKAILLRPPGSHGFIELTEEQALAATKEFEQLILLAPLGEKASPLQQIGVQMLLGWDYEYFAKTEKPGED